MRGYDAAKLWPGDARVVECSEMEFVWTAYNVYVHVKYACAGAFRWQGGAHVWDVVDNFKDQHAWAVDWDGAILGTGRALEDFCDARSVRYPCALVQHLPNLECAVHTNDTRRAANLRVGIVGTGGATDKALMRTLASVPWIKVLEERNTCYHGATALWPVALASGAPTQSCAYGGSCSLFWDVIDVAVVWTKDDVGASKSFYKPCTRFATAGALRIPVVAHAEFKCVQDVLLDGVSRNMITASTPESVLATLRRMRDPVDFAAHQRVVAMNMGAFSKETVVHDYEALFARAVRYAQSRR